MKKDAKKVCMQNHKIVLQNSNKSNIYFEASNELDKEKIILTIKNIRIKARILKNQKTILKGLGDENIVRKV